MNRDLCSTRRPRSLAPVRIMKHCVPLLFAALISPAFAEDAPSVFDGLLKPGVSVQGEIGMVVPPKEIDKYIAKVEASARQNVDWFREHTKNAKPGMPLPYDEKLGLTKEEYAAYLELWAKREFQAVEKVLLLLRKSSGGTWTITSTGGGSPISTMRYDPEDDTFQSPNGKLNRINDISAEPEGILGAWTGKEWKFEEETSLGLTKENLALGRMTGKNHGLIIYRVQELSSQGTRLLDKSLIIRFPLAKAAQ